MLDTRVRVDQVQDYLSEHDLVLIHDDNYNIGIEYSSDTGQVGIHTNHLAGLNEVITSANTRRDILLEEVGRLEAQINTVHELNSTSVYSP